MANYTTAADLLDDILWRAGESASATGDRTSDFATVALTYLNRVYQSICLGGGELLPDMFEDWWWLYKKPPGVLTLNPEYNTGSVNVTNNSTAGTFSNAPTSSLQGWFLKVQGSLPGNADVFRISSHTANQAPFTLDSVFTGSTNATATFDAFQLEYTLASDILRLISPMRQYRTSDPDYFIYQVDAASGDASFPLALVEGGMPTRYEIVNIDSSGSVTVRFNRWGGTVSTDYMRVEYDYLFTAAAITDAAGSVPLVPQQYRRILADWAVFFIFTDKNDDRAQQIGAMAKAGLRAMQLENQKRLGSASRFRMGAIQYRPNDWFRSQPLRTQTGLILG